MPHEQNIELVKTVMEQLLAGNPEPLLSSISDDAVMQAVIPAGTPISGEFRGREGFLRYLEAANEVMEILEVKAHDYTASADHVVILAFERARVRQTGKLLDCETATSLRIENGKITKVVAWAEMSPIIEAYLS